MSESPFGSAPADLPPWPTQGFPPPQRSTRWPVIVAIVLASAALIVGIIGCFRPASEKPTATETTATTPHYSNQQVTEAQNAVCDAFLESSHAINVATSAQNDDPVQKVLISIHGRLAFQAAASHLFHVLSNNPATPFELAKNVRELASEFETFVIARISDKPESEVEPLTHNMEIVDGRIRKECT